MPWLDHFYSSPVAIPLSLVVLAAISQSFHNGAYGGVELYFPF